MPFARLTARAAIVLFVALHGWPSLGALNNLAAVRAADSRTRLCVTTLVSALPFAVVPAGTAIHLTPMR